MKRFLLMVILLIAVISQSFAGFDLLWYKNIPNVMQINDVVFSNDSKWILCTAGGKPNLYIFDVLTGQVINDTIKFGLDKPFFSPDDKKIIGVMNNKFYSYDIATGTLEDRFDSIPGKLDIHNFYYDKKRIFVGNETGFHTIDFETGKIIQSKVTGDKEGIGCIYYLNITNQIICTKGKEYFKGLDGKGNPIYEYTNRINLYDFNSLDSVGNFYNKIEKYFNKEDYMAWIRMSHNQERIAIMYLNTDKIEIYEYPTMKLVSKFNIFDTGSITDLKFTSDDKYLIIAQRSSGDNLTQWEVETGKLVNERNGGFNTLDLTNNDRYIGSAGANMVGVFIVPTTDVTNPKENHEILYPNPTNGMLTITNKNYLDGLYFYQISDLNGNIIQKDKINFVDGNGNINLSKIPNGTYFLIINNDTYKFIVGD